MTIPSQNLDLFWLANPSTSFLTTHRPGIPAYRVGEPLQHGRSSWPVGAQYHHAVSGHELTIFYPEIDDDIIHDVKRGEAEFALIVEHPLLLLAYRFGKTRPWSEIPYSWHMQPARSRIVPSYEPSRETRALLWITLVGAEDGLIHAQRGLTLAPDFTRVLQNAIRAQARTRFQPDECLRALTELLIDRPMMNHRLHLAQARTVGNR
jgi:hypothetical protein